MPSWAQRFGRRQGEFNYSGPAVLESEQNGPVGLGPRPAKRDRGKFSINGPVELISKEIGSEADTINSRMVHSTEVIQMGHNSAKFFSNDLVGGPNSQLVVEDKGDHMEPYESDMCQSKEHMHPVTQTQGEQFVVIASNRNCSQRSQGDANPTIKSDHRVLSNSTDLKAYKPGEAELFEEYPVEIKKKHAKAKAKEQ